MGGSHSQTVAAGAPGAAAGATGLDADAPRGPSVGSVTAAEVILDWDGLAMPTLGELAEIIERHRTVTAADVLDFIRHKLAGLREVCPEYISFTVDAIQLNAGAPVYSKFRAYSAVTASFEGHDPDELIRLLGDEARGRTEAEVLRGQAAELLSRADQLETKQSRPPGG